MKKFLRYMKGTQHYENLIEVEKDDFLAGIELDGVDQYMYHGEPSANTDELFTLNDFTISFFVKVPSGSGKTALVEIGEKFTREKMISIKKLANGHIQVYIADNDTGSNGSGEKIDVSGPDLRDDAWHHVAVVRAEHVPDGQPVRVAQRLSNGGAVHQ